MNAKGVVELSSPPSEWALRELPAHAYGTGSLDPAEDASDSGRFRMKDRGWLAQHVPWALPQQLRTHSLRIPCRTERATDETHVALDVAFPGQLG